MKEPNMKLLSLPGGGLLLFAIGLLMPEQITARYVFLALAVTLTLAFYVITLTHVIKTFLKGNNKRLFWLVAIICMPVIGNVIYIIFLGTANKAQEPHGIF